MELRHFSFKTQNANENVTKGTTYLFSSLQYIMDLTFARSIPSIAGYNASKYYFYYIYRIMKDNKKLYNQ